MGLNVSYVDSLHFIFRSALSKKILKRVEVFTYAIPGLGELNLYPYLANIYIFVNFVNETKDETIIYLPFFFLGSYVLIFF